MQPADHASRQTASYWDDWQRLQQASRETAARQNFVDWAGHPSIWGRICEAAFGSEDRDVLDFVLSAYPDLQRAQVLSLCCGDGAFERDLVRRHAAGSVLGIDLSSARIESAIEATSREDENMRRACRFKQADLNHVPFAEGRFDAVFAKSALHHLHALEDLFAHLATLLRPEGLLIALDFFGPSRFQWTDQQLVLANGFWQQHAPLDCRFRANGEEDLSVDRPTVEQMKSLDPSEAIRSGELIDCMKQAFVVERYLPMGGTLLNLIFWGERVNRFNPENPIHLSFINKAFDYEQALLQRGHIPSDFALVIARPL